jgi:transcription-repair coupling factor (superfamily II helicase)
LGKIRPQLGKIGSGRWEKARLAAERATLDVAAELLRVQARRESQPGYSFGSETEWQREFEASFPFTETRDQLKAIAETKADMERNRPMDRLICGDVGFGKTEVAIRAAFKAVQDGKQVAVLIPTTVLAQQHLNTFRERMAGYPIAVEMISRFKTPKEQKAILEATSLGQVDILIGTHRLIQEDVIFKDLGLVIIDEEQRFGVRHKEVFKRMRESVDVLSMSATPVPRTLYLALTGARDLSVIETAPTNRHPIQTIVKTYDEQVVVDAIRHEIRRGGQVFYLHNRVSTIQNVANRLTQLLPGIKVGIGHGKMDADSLEQVMTEFVAGKNQVLVCTTIIESGLDIPNCNTIIIEGADRFGLSQLYQLRGRVGRFKHQAYAYLLLHKHTKLLEIARQRLTALRQHNQLGAGFRIAMRDLELRGAGNLLGTEQSGHIVGVGFELYCQLLRQSVARLKGETAASYIRAAVKLDFISTGEKINHSQKTAGRRDDSYTAIKDAENVADGAIPIEPIQALIPAAYVTETRLRIDLYRKLALTIDLEGLKKIVDEIKDRFGAYGEEVKALILTTKIRILAEQKKLLLVECESHRLKCLRNSGRRDDWVMPGSRFPRLTAAKALLRLEEIVCFLNNLPNT